MIYFILGIYPYRHTAYSIEYTINHMFNKIEHTSNRVNKRNKSGIVLVYSHIEVIRNYI